MWFLGSLYNRGKSQRTTRRAVICAAVVILGCTSVSGAGIAEVTQAARSGQTLSPAQLQSLMAKNLRFKGLPEGSTTGARRLEFFYADRKYQGCADRAPLQGTYALEGDRICTSVAGYRQCRTLLRSQSGTYLERYESENPGQRLPAAVEITPARRSDTCFHSGA